LKVYFRHNPDIAVFHRVPLMRIEGFFRNFFAETIRLEFLI